MLTTDYLIVGAGAASLAFVDTLLTEQPDARVVIVDKHVAPGGHWNDAYGFVHLHQPSLLYGVASDQLEGNWAKLLLKGGLPWQHRASKTELLAYYEKQMNSWVAGGNVQYFPKCIYDFETPPVEDVHTFHRLDGSKTYKVKVDVKLVNGILGECKVPSVCGAPFPVDDDITLLTPNDVYDVHRSSKSNDSQTGGHKKFVVLGAGKTGMDTVVFLQRTMHVSPDDISWVVPNDVWMLSRSSNKATPYSWTKALTDENLDFDKAALSLEKDGAFVRLDKNVLPTRFRFPVIGKDELKYLRRIKNVIRRGRVSGISQEEVTKDTRVEFGAGKPAWILHEDHTFVHCTSPGPFNGNEIPPLFVSEKEMNLFLLYAPPVPISMSSLAKLESERRKGNLDLAFGRKLLVESGVANNVDDLSENDVLRHLIAGYDVASTSLGQVRPMKVLASFFALMNEDPMEGLKWCRANRLAFFSVPGFKSEVYEYMLRLAENYEQLGFSEVEAKQFDILGEKLKTLEGK